MTNSAYSFYQPHLNRVSRSFSFCIAELEGALQEQVALSYLLFRLIDTVEDSNWQDAALQQQAFNDFEAGLNQQKAPADFASWQLRFPEDISTAEQALLKATPKLLTDLFQLDKPIQIQLINNLKQMQQGMQHFLKFHSQNNQLKLTNLTEVNQYCFFVAGLIGELLSTLFAYHFNDFQLSDDVLGYAFHFGLFLQKINILKDQQQDQRIGRQLIPNWQALRDSLTLHAYYALQYIKQLPVIEGRQPRIFCAWSLFIGLASLPWLDKSHHQGKQYKLPRLETRKLINKVKRIIDDNQALTALFNEYITDEIDLTPPLMTKQQLPLWFSQIYPIEKLQPHAHLLELLSCA